MSHSSNFLSKPNEHKITRFSRIQDLQDYKIFKYSNHYYKIIASDSVMQEDENEYKKWKACEVVLEKMNKKTSPNKKGSKVSEQFGKGSPKSWNSTEIKKSKNRQCFQFIHSLVQHFRAKDKSWCAYRVILYWRN
jgi:hypothetical protein